MAIRTDLIDEQQPFDRSLSGIMQEEQRIGDVTVHYVTVRDEESARQLGKPCGTYATVCFDDLISMPDDGNLRQAIVATLSRLLPDSRESILVVGLGNTDITPDAIGPQTVDRLLATRHISRELASSLGLFGLMPVSVLIPGVIGKTGIEAAEIVRGAVERIHPSAVIAIDALAARDPERLCRTVQFCDSGINPGSGVNNARRGIDRIGLGIPVIAIGIPTVVDTESLIESMTGSEAHVRENMMVTPKDIDLLVRRAAELLGSALNTFLQPALDEKTIAAFV